MGAGNQLQSKTFSLKCDLLTIFEHFWAILIIFDQFFFNEFHSCAGESTILHTFQKKCSYEAGLHIPEKNSGFNPILRKTSSYRSRKSSSPHHIFQDFHTGFSGLLVIFHTHNKFHTAFSENKLGGGKTTRER